MFGFFKKKSEKQKLEEEYKQLMEASYRLSHTDREASAKKSGEAEEILKRLEQLS
ncbi:MAG: Lacal_2735 family protein [Aureispira sp.]